MAPQTIPRYFFIHEILFIFLWVGTRSKVSPGRRRCCCCTCQKIKFYPVPVLCVCVCVETVRRAVENGRRLWSIHTLRRETTECLFDSFHADAAMYNTWPPVDLTRLSSISLLHSNKSAGQQQTEKKITSAQLSTLWWWGHWIFLIAIINGIITSRRDLSSSPVLNNLLLLLRSMSEITTTTTTFSCVCVGLHSKAQIPFLFFCSD
jgi:hypothetical protein